MSAEKVAMSLGQISSHWEPVDSSSWVTNWEGHSFCLQGRSISVNRYFLILSALRVFLITCCYKVIYALVCFIVGFCKISETCNTAMSDVLYQTHAAIFLTEVLIVQPLAWTFQFI